MVLGLMVVGFRVRFRVGVYGLRLRVLGNKRVERLF